MKSVLTDERIRDIHWSKPMDEYQFAHTIEAEATAPLLARIAELEQALAERHHDIKEQP